MLCIRDVKRMLNRMGLQKLCKSAMSSGQMKSIGTHDLEMKFNVATPRWRKPEGQKISACERNMSMRLVHCKSGFTI